MGEKPSLWRLQDLGVEAFSRMVRSDFPKHSHDEWQVARIAHGVNRWWYRHAYYDATPENLAVIPPGDVHGTYKADEPPWVLKTLYIPDLVFQQALAEWDSASQEGSLRPPVLFAPQLLATFETFWDLATGAATALERSSALAELVGGLALRGVVSQMAMSATSPGSAAVLRAREFLHTHPEREISLADLADLAGSGPFRLNREFRRIVGVPPYAYQIQLRVRRAEQLLAEGVQVAEAAQQAGFADQSHLGRHFKRFVAITPGHYRRVARTF